MRAATTTKNNEPYKLIEIHYIHTDTHTQKRHNDDDRLNYGYLPLFHIIIFIHKNIYTHTHTQALKKLHRKFKCNFKAKQIYSILN